MELSIQLTFKGDCEAAFKFYERCLGARITLMLTWGNSPMADQAPKEWREKVLHASLAVGDTVLSGADVLPGQYEQPRGFSVLLSVDEPADAERVFHALAENGTDQFGTPWEIHCEQAP